MNSSAGTMGDADIHAFGPPPEPLEQAPFKPPLKSPSTPRRRWPWVLAGAALLGLLVMLLLASMVSSSIDSLAGWQGVPIVIDDNGVRSHWDAADLLVATFGIGVALLVVIVVVPLVLLGVGLAVGAALTLAALSLAAVVALGLGGLLLVLAVATAPVWLLVLLIWWLARRPSQPAAAAPPQQAPQ